MEIMEKHVDQIDIVRQIATIYYSQSRQLMTAWIKDTGQFNTHFFSGGYSKLFIY